MQENYKNIHKNHSEINLEYQKDIKEEKKLLYDKINKIKKLKPKFSKLSDKDKIKQKNELVLNISKKFTKEKNKILSKNRMIRNLNINNKNTKNITTEIIYNNINTTNISYHKNNIITDKRPILSKKETIIRTHTKSLSMSDISVNKENTDEIEKDSSRLKSLRTYSEDSNKSDKKVKDPKGNDNNKVKPDDLFKSLNIKNKNGKILKVSNQNSLSNSYIFKNSNKIKSKIKLNGDKKSMIIKKLNAVPQIKTNLIEKSFKYYLKLNKKNDAKINKNKISPKTHINNNRQKRIISNDRYNKKNIIKTEKENKNKNKISKAEQIELEHKQKLSKNLNISNPLLNTKFNLIKDFKNKIPDEKTKKNINDFSKDKHYTKLNQYLTNSNTLISNIKNASSHRNEKNLVYAPKKIKIRLNEDEKKSINLSNNNDMSFSQHLAKRNSYKILNCNNFYSREDNIKSIFIKNNDDFSSPNLTLKLSFNNENNNKRNNVINYLHTSLNQGIKERNNSLNYYRGINTDYDDYSNINKSAINNRAFVEKKSISPSVYKFGKIISLNHHNNKIDLTNFNNNNINANMIPLFFGGSSNYNLFNDSMSHLYANEIDKMNKIINFSSINIEDLIILQEKLKYVIIALNKIQTDGNECFEFLNFYYNSSIYCQLEKSFTNLLEANSVRININFILISVIICYDYSFETDIMNKAYKTLLNIIKLNYKNLLIIYEHILSKICIESKNNIWVKKLTNIINSYKRIEPIQINHLSKITELNYNANIIFHNLILILRNFRTYRNEYFLNFFNDIMNKSYAQINIFFREYILRTNNLNGSILASVYLKTEDIKNFKSVPSPYIHTENNKNYSLVLDLDETLIHYKEVPGNEGKGLLCLRPGLRKFFDEVGKYYELIVFTTATQDYADTLIDAIEADKIYFDHRFYRNHTIIINNDFVKDLTRIGRPLDKIIIVDNMPQNFRLQKENGIMIKPFWGEDKYDTALIDLIPILINIYKDGGDVRKGLIKYKDDILKKVSSTMSKEIM